MNSKELANEVVGLLDPDKNISGEIVDVLTELIDDGVIDHRQVKRAILKRAYLNEYKANGNQANSAFLQVAADYGVSMSYVKNSVYYHDEIKV